MNTAQLHRSIRAGGNLARRAQVGGAHEPEFLFVQSAKAMTFVAAACVIRIPACT